MICMKWVVYETSNIDIDYVQLLPPFIISSLVDRELVPLLHLASSGHEKLKYVGSKHSKATESF